MSSDTFKYRCCLHGHTQDVRGLTSFANDNHDSCLLSCSRDKTARMWEPIRCFGGFDETECYMGHKNFVSCVVFMPPLGDVYPKGLIFTGSNDKTIKAYAPGSSSAILSFSGHSDTVCSIAVGKFGSLVSGSWDKSAKLWVMDAAGYFTKEPKCAFTMSGHKAAVWDVLIMPSTVPEAGLIVTASADSLIKLWKAGSCKLTLSGHTDCVRGLATLSDTQFLSCANDATVKRWNITGECLETYYGHRNFVYSVAVLPGVTEFVTASEDRTVRVWSLDKNTSKQTIAIPAQSPWKVAVLHNGDVAVGCSDATIRVFSRDAERRASDDQLRAFEEELAKSKIAESSSDLGDIDVKSLPGRDALQRAGQKDGQTLMVRHQGVVEAYQWNVGEARWVKVGDVVGSSGENRTTYKGREYDYVFTVDIEEGKPPLHLPYNMSDDPWMAAQKFIDDHNLSQYYLETVANFIFDNTQERREGGPSANGAGYHDPYTGEGRYVPGQAVNGSAAGGGADPFTGGGRHIPSGDSHPVSHAPVHDPMTAPSRYVPDDEGSGGTKTQEANPYFPKEGFIFFENANVSAMLNKIKEFSEKTPQVLSAEDAGAFERLTRSGYECGEAEVEKLWALLHWPSEFLFPALDLLRVFVVRQPSLARFLTEDRAEELLSILLRSLSSSSSDSDLRSDFKPSAANRLLALRCLCNMTASPEGQALLVAGNVEIVSTLGGAEWSDRNSEIAAATLLVNYAVLVNASGGRCEEARLSCVRACVRQLATGRTHEAVFRTLVALGSLLHANDVAVAVANSLDVIAAVEVASHAHHQVEKVRGCALRVLQLIK